MKRIKVIFSKNCLISEILAFFSILFVLTSYADTLSSGFWEKYNQWVAQHQSLPSENSANIDELDLVKLTKGDKEKIRINLTEMNLNIPSVKIHFEPSTVLNDWFQEHNFWPRYNSSDKQQSLIAFWIADDNTNLYLSNEFNAYLKYLNEDVQKRPFVWKGVVEIVESVRWAERRSYLPFLQNVLPEKYQKKVPVGISSVFGKLGREKSLAMIDPRIRKEILFLENPLRDLLENQPYIVLPDTVLELPSEKQAFVYEWMKHNKGINQIKSKLLSKSEGQRIVTRAAFEYIKEINDYLRTLEVPSLSLPRVANSHSLTDIQKKMRSIFSRHGSNGGFYHYFLESDLKEHPNLMWEFDKQKYIENWLKANPNLGFPQLVKHGEEQTKMRAWIDKSGGVKGLLKRLPDDIKELSGVMVAMLKLGFVDPEEALVSWIKSNRKWPRGQHIKYTQDRIEQKKKRNPLENYLFNWIMLKGKKNCWDYFLAPRKDIDLSLQLDLLYEISPIEALEFWVRKNIEANGKSSFPKGGRGKKGFEAKLSQWAGSQGGNIVAWALLDKKLQPQIEFENTFKVRDFDQFINDLSIYYREHNSLPSLENKGKDTKDRQERILAAHLLYYKEQFGERFLIEINDLAPSEKFSLEFCSQLLEKSDPQ